NFGMLRQLDVSDFRNPQVTATLILTRFVGDTSDDLLSESNPTPEGRPIKVLIAGDYAFVATVGVGVQVVDLTAMTLPIYNIKHRSYSEPNLKDMALYVKDNALDIVLSGSSMHTQENVDADPELEEVAVSFKAISAANFAQISRVRSTQLAGPANNIEVLHSYLIDIDADGRTGPAEDSDLDNIVTERDLAHTDPRSYELHDLAFIASGIFGIHVLDITEISDPKFLGTIKVGEGVTAADLKLDAQNLRLYVPVGADGIYIVDIKDPFLINPDAPPQVIGKIQIENTITDGNVTIDEELNTVYVATRDKGLKSVLVGKLNVEIVTDGATPGTYQHVAFINSAGVGTIVENEFVPFAPGTPFSLLKAQPPTKFYVLALLPSGAGGETGEVQVKVNSTNFFGQAIRLGAGFPDTEFETKVKYVAPADNNASHRLYVSDPFYITAHPLLPVVGDHGVEVDDPILSAGDFVEVQIDEAIQSNLNYVTTDLLRQSVFAARALRMDWIDSEKPEPKQNPVIGTGETAYPPYLHSGEWTLPAVDFGIKGRGFDFVFTRKYESQALYDGPLGFGWDHAYFARINEMPNGDVFYYDGMGRKEHFVYIPQDQCTPSETNNCNAYGAPAGVFAILQKLKDGNWLITESDGMSLLFNNYGQLARIQDRNENKLEFFYDPAGKLSVAVDTLGRAIFYEYN
ncbi:MAG TPA: DUF6531 domain-containing protein, partial [Acidobacteriota bacterium]